MCIRDRCIGGHALPRSLSSSLPRSPPHLRSSATLRPSPLRTSSSARAEHTDLEELDGDVELGVEDGAVEVVVLVHALQHHRHLTVQQPALHEVLGLLHRPTIQCRVSARDHPRDRPRDYRRR
eukprot:1439867-Rhodomonas_salina.1